MPPLRLRLHRLLPRTLPTRSLHHSHPLHLDPPSHYTPAETSIFNKLHSAFLPSKLEVQDISGGCGSMYGLEIESKKFKGLSVVKQHRLVNEVLKEEIGAWHGVQLRTRAVE